VSRTTNSIDTALPMLWSPTLRWEVSTTWIVWCTTWMTIEFNYAPLGSIAVRFTPGVALKWVLNR